MATCKQITRLAIPELMGKNFFIPDYQRGYRWEKEQVHQLLQDLWRYFNDDSKGFYCLQPIVVKKCDAAIIGQYNLQSDYDDNTWYEVIDGQQRLTTIRILMAFYMVDQRQMNLNVFKLFYATRHELGDIFKEIDIDYNNFTLKLDIKPELQNVDYVYIENCASSILAWFREEANDYEGRARRNDFGTFLSTFFHLQEDKKSVQVLWFEADNNNDARDVFERINDLKIPLSCSELIRALFLSESASYNTPVSDDLTENEKKLVKERDKKTKQDSINAKWDEIEHRLRSDKQLWAFLTNKEESIFRNRIELLFDLVTGKNTQVEAPYKLNKNDNLYTFLYFDRKTKSGEDLWDIWLQVQACYSRLCNWFEDSDTYHQIGYLSYIKEDTILTELLQQSGLLTKTGFRELIVDKIVDTMPVASKIPQLNYENRDDCQQIQRILLLHNIESTRQAGKERFPFDLFKEEERKNGWTLEHIHAQNSQCLDQTQRDQWHSWAKVNKEALQNFIDTEGDGKSLLIDRLEEAIAKTTPGRLDPKFRYEDIKRLFEDVLHYFDHQNTTQGNPATLHQISNLALLSGSTNTSIGNSVFEVKRQFIVKNDAEGSYIPICTKKVFLKYFYDASNGELPARQVHHWSFADRKNYLSDIQQKLAQYLPSNSFTVNAQ